MIRRPPRSTLDRSSAASDVYKRQGDQAVVLRGPRLAAIIKQFFYDTEWPELDYLIIDLPPGTGDVQLTLVQTIPLTGVVMVTTPQEVAYIAVSYTHLRAHETVLDLVCRLLLEKKK